MVHRRRLVRLVTAVLVAFTLSVPAVAWAVTDFLGIPGPIAFAGTDYHLGWSSQPKAEYTKQEYVPAGQSPQTFKSMVMVEFLETGMTAMQMASAQVATLEQRKQTDPLVNMALVTNKETGEVILDFIVSARDTSGQTIVEWNGYRYANATNSKGQAGGLLFAISRRAYGDEAARSFLQTLRTFKDKQLLALAQAALPEL